LAPGPLPHSFGGYFVICAPLPLAGLRRRKSTGRWKEWREDETWEGGKVRIGGLVSSIPREKRELPPVTGG